MGSGLFLLRGLVLVALVGKGHGQTRFQSATFAIQQLQRSAMLGGDGVHNRQAQAIAQTYINAIF